MFGSIGPRPGELKEPNGLATDSKGNVYVADTGNHRVQKFSGDGRYITEWRGPTPGFYGPRDVWVSADDLVYVVDQGRSRIVKFDQNGVVLATWGSQGSGDLQFDEPTTVTVDSKRDRVYVADPHHRRIQVFDTKGNFVTKWLVNDWQPAGWSFQDIVVDPEAERLYVNSPTTDSILVYDLAGTKLKDLKPEPPNALEGVSAITISNGKLYAISAFADRVRQIDLRDK
jgi:DNA-binding beta-propeller fold protein YncE